MLKEISFCLNFCYFFSSLNSLVFLQKSILQVLFLLFRFLPESGLRPGKFWLWSSWENIRDGRLPRFLFSHLSLQWLDLSLFSLAVVIFVTMESIKYIIYNKYLPQIIIEAGLPGTALVRAILRLCFLPNFLRFSLEPEQLKVIRVQL